MRGNASMSHDVGIAHRSIPSQHLYTIHKLREREDATQRSEQRKTSAEGVPRVGLQQLGSGEDFFLRGIKAISSVTAA